tara:strand:- start:4656 stop:4886 length:231 start_codon:yes stop_codon:yes gene_type:complete
VTSKELTDIRSQWRTPCDWEVKVDDERIDVHDEDGNLVVSSILHSYVEGSITEHLGQAEAAAEVDLLLALYGDVES